MISKNKSNKNTCKTSIGKRSLLQNIEKTRYHGDGWVGLNELW